MDSLSFANKKSLHWQKPVLKYKHSYDFCQPGNSLSRLLRNTLSILAVLALLTNSIGMLHLQYSDPDSGPGAASQDRGDTSSVFAPATDDDHSSVKHAGCNHGCHVVNHLLTHLNLFPAILAIVLLMVMATSFLATHVLLLLVKPFFKPPR